MAAKLPVSSKLDLADEDIAKSEACYKQGRYEEAFDLMCRAGKLLASLVQEDGVTALRVDAEKTFRRAEEMKAAIKIRKKESGVMTMADEMAALRLALDDERKARATTERTVDDLRHDLATAQRELADVRRQLRDSQDQERKAVRDSSLHPFMRRLSYC